MGQQGPIFTYRQKIREEILRPDPAQELAVEKLQSLSNALSRYHPDQGSRGWLSRFGFRSNHTCPCLGWIPADATNSNPRQGLYIFGEVGRGKSMLMDLFFETCPISHKKRLHFHEFMRDIHAAIHQWRKDGSSKHGDPVPMLVNTLAQEACLLCLDELQITDIADAMIVGRLFQAILDAGVVVVITSNRAPQELYKDGLQRDRFLPFIALIQQRLDILELNSERDYRLGRKRGLKVYHAPSGPQATETLDQTFARLTAGAEPRPDTLSVNERTLDIPLAAAGVARFSFADLCGRPLGAADYLALASRCHALMLDDIPLLSPENKDEARRFVTLVDALYEHKVTLICSAAAPPESLYPTGIGAFEFQRTVSRLMEMQAEDYITREHLT